MTGPAILLLLLTALYPARLATSQGQAARLASSIAPPTAEFTLRNGLRVIVRRDRRIPQVALVVSYDVGSRDEEPGRHGTAHLFEHLYFAGTARFPGDFYERALALGARQTNGSTDFDRSRFYWTVPADRLDDALAIEADRMAHAARDLSEEKLERERKIVLAEIASQARSLDGAVKAVAFPAMFGKAHPYGHLPGGAREHLMRTSVVDARDWIGRMYRPNRATLVLVGDVTVRRAREAVERHFGLLEPAPARRADVSSSAGTPAHLTLPEIRTRSVTRYAALPPLGPESRAALELAVALLRPAVTATIRRYVGESASVDFWYRPSERAGNIGVRVAAPGATRGEMNAAISAALRAARQGVAADLEIARLGLVADRFRSVETLLGEALARADGAAGRIDRLVRIDAATVHGAAERWLGALPVRVDTGADARPEHPAAVEPNARPGSVFPEVRRRVLAQGLPVAVASWPGPAMAALRLTLRTPAGASATDRQVLANLLASRLAPLVELGGTAEAVADDAGLMVAIRVPGDAVGPALGLTRNALSGEPPGEKEFAAVRARAASMSLDPVQLVRHPSVAEAEALSLDTWRDFVGSSLGAGSVTLVSGFGSDEALRLLGDAFEDVKGAAHPAPDPSAGGGASIMVDPRVGAAELVLTATIPHAAADEAALRAATRALAGGTAALLDAELRRRRGWTYGARLELLRAPAGWTLAVRVPIEPVHACEAIAVTRAAVGRLAARTRDAERAIRLAAPSLIADTVAALETPATLAAFIAESADDADPRTRQQKLLMELRDARLAERAAASVGRLRETMRIVFVNNRHQPTASCRG